ncbi:hypothetical protein [Komarekiella delphini-convector]|uniref:hypothetical protein n=1 Tax=Komarekiella delphini-convector TaxID=3050158 RepID=UPI0017837839|nr:hypothetical protein [Komarekiella delphini-convector]
MTDACILKEICQSQLGRVSLAMEVEAFQKRFLQLLIDGAAASAGVKAISGASEILKKLLASPEYQVAYAGGGWAASAIFKLKSARLPIENISYAFSGDLVRSPTSSRSRGSCSVYAKDLSHYEALIYLWRFDITYLRFYRCTLKKSGLAWV